MTGLLFLVAGVALVAAGLFLLFGPWSLVGVGLALIVSGLMIPWEELTRAKPAPTPPRR